MKKKELLSLIKKILLSKRLIKKNINLGYFKIKKNQTIEKIINKVYK